jgi:hypothetical protein
MFPRFLRVGEEHRKLYHKPKPKVFGAKEFPPSFPIAEGT